MNKCRLHLCATAIVLLAFSMLPGCTELRQKSVQAREDNLSAAGFVIKPANTPERQDMLIRLPPNKFVTRVHQDSVHYVYADPVVCNCLYVGSQQAYQQYQQHEQQQRITADTYSDSAWRWGAWGPWDPAWGFDNGRG